MANTSNSAVALDLLKDIRKATFDHAAPLPSKEDTQAVWQGVGFQIGGVRLVSPIGEVSEILKMPRLAALPVVKPWMLGIANVRGRLIPIIDLHEYFDVSPTVQQAQWRVLIVEDEELAAGLLVEQSLGIQHFLEDGFEAVETNELAGLGQHVNGAFRHSGRMYYQIDLRSILRDEQFFDVAENTK